MNESERAAPFDIELSEGCMRYAQILPVQSSSGRLTSYQNSIRSLPLPPAMWNAFQRAVSEEASNQQLAEIIKEDPVLAAAILRSVNSAGFGLRMPINDIARAISHLGHTLVRSIVARHAFSSKVTTGRAYDIPMLWRHGMAVSSIAEIVADHIHGCDRSEAGTLGLFHDIGRIAFNLFSEFMVPTELDLQQGHLVYEQQRFGCTHIELGLLLARQWQLPEKIVQGISWHHHPAHSEAETIPNELRPQVLAVYLADLLAIHFGLGGGDPGVIAPHPSFAPMMKTTLQQIADDSRIQTELTRIRGIEF